MATGGRENTTDAAVDDKEEKEAEAVFLSYAFHMSARSENEDSRPLSDELEHARQRQMQDSKYNIVGQQFAAIGDNINRENEEKFDKVLKELDPNLENAYDIFKNIASSVFKTGVNWGRILMLLGFGYRMAVYIWRKGHHGFLKKIAWWLARYLVENSILRWITRHGGWEAALTLTNYGVKYVLMALGVVLILQFVMGRISSSGQ
ncbi:bcl-2 homologous antagonist/killer-like [Dendropsophus ebraccatus]|uniref:bcl-2 homologous antagonist/killer-like n=1 Tax=Dendropsophus ebraccatus TaxID=150705 RepID=UPI0038321C6D